MRPRAVRVARVRISLEAENATEAFPLVTRVFKVDDGGARALAFLSSAARSWAFGAPIGPPKKADEPAKAARPAKPAPRREIPEPPANFPKGWPPDENDVSRLDLVAPFFIAQFANCPEPAKQARFMRAYIRVLAAMRGRGASIFAAWRAFADAWLAASGAPLFAPAAAIDFLRRAR